MCYYLVVLIIGFLESNTSVKVSEGEGEISFLLGVISGILQYTLSVDIEATALSALSMLICVAGSYCRLITIAD